MRTMGTESLHPFRPRRECAAGDVRLGDMVDDETDFREIGDRLEGGGQLARPDEKVVGKSSAADLRETLPDILAQQPTRIGLVVDLMP